MGWLSNRRAKKNMEKYFGKEYTANLVSELREGTKVAENMRDELRKLESPQYRQMIKTINQIVDGNAPTDQKKIISIKLVEQSKMSDWEKRDLLEQLDSIYGKSEEK